MGENTATYLYHSVVAIALNIGERKVLCPHDVCHLSTSTYNGGLDMNVSGRADRNVDVGTGIRDVT